MGERATALAAQEGWRGEGYAARIHYDGASDRYSIEYYEPTGVVVYWRVIEEGAAVPVARDSIPDVLRDRVRQDLAEAGIDPDIEGREL